MKRFVALLLLSAATSLCAQEETSAPVAGVYRVNVRVEVVDAQVIHKKTGQPVTSLKREDFQVYEDKTLQQISAFSQDELPMSVVLLFDLTDSVRPVLKQLAAGAMEALGHLKPQDDVAVMVYAASARLLQEPTTDRTLAAAAIEKASRMESKEAAFFNEGIFQAAAQLGKAADPSRRRVIIWLTDDVPNIPSDDVRAQVGRSVPRGALHTEQQAMAEVLRVGAVVCTLLKRSEISDREDSNRSSAKIMDRMMYPPGEVYKYARATGGQVIEASGKKLKARLTELIDDLRMRYSLSYHPSAPKPKGKFCSIQVKLAPETKKAQKDVVVEAKQGYYR
ncbi:MAG TPA: VWA domain-containing protein [Candidatus Angelobacter sp.]|nr:VWA domain-containing protein [Candidatus Angelobacter sp.]